MAHVAASWLARQFASVWLVSTRCREIGHRSRITYVGAGSMGVVSYADACGGSMNAMLWYGIAVVILAAIP